MNRLKIVAAMALLVTWTPATSLCLIENAGWLAKNDGCCDTQSSETLPCCALASASYKIDEIRSATAPSPSQLFVVLIGFVDLAPSPQQFANANQRGVSPPELSTSWQFSSRAALGPRAPSSAS